MKNQMFWWLSFADPALPTGKQFLGACLIEGEDIAAAVAAATFLGINPGGEVLGAAADPATTVLIPERWKNRLLSKKECGEMDEEVLALQDAVSIPIPHAPEEQFICSKHNVVTKAEGAS